MNTAEDISQSLKEYIALPTIKRFHESPAQIRCIVGPVGCYSGDTEFLTPYGWKRFDQYAGEYVAQWDADTGYMSFCFPKRFIKEPCDSFYHFSSEHSLSMVLSPEHRMPLYDYRGNFKVMTAAQVAVNPSKYTVPINFIPDLQDYPIPDAELRVMVMFCADGSVQQNGFKQRVVVRKERKHKRIKTLLEEAGIQFTEHPSASRENETGYAFIPPIKTKRYSPWAWKLSVRQMAIVVDEMQYWDGLYEGTDCRFSTTSKEDADFMQYAVHAVGGRATISCERHPEKGWADQYIVHIAKPGSLKAKAMLRCDNTSIREVKSADGFKYCFEVGTGFLVVRHDGRIFISGNSGKTSGAAWEVCYYLPHFLAQEYAIKNTRWVVVRNTYAELRDTTMRTVFDWFPWGHHQKVDNIYTLVYPDGITVEILFRSCDRPDDVKKFKSLEITGYWIDESIEIAEEIKNMLKNRIGRYPQKCPVRFGIETTNPPDVEHPTYSQFAWDPPPPGPIPKAIPLKNHIGFWQPPGENNKNLRPGYYDDLRSDYASDPDWIDMYIDGKPGMVIRGKLVYNNFDRSYHVAKEPLIWAQGLLYRGWDNSGNSPACVVLQMPQLHQLQVLAEFYSDKENIIDFTDRVSTELNIRYPNANYQDWGDPAGENKYSTRAKGFTSNAELMREECGVAVMSSEQNFQARIESVEKALNMRDGLLIDSSCTRIINGFLGGYCYPEIGNTGIYGEAPIKNKYSHIHDALQYVAVRILGGTRKKRMSAAEIERLRNQYGPPVAGYDRG